MIENEVCIASKQRLSFVVILVREVSYTYHIELYNTRAERSTMLSERGIPLYRAYMLFLTMTANMKQWQE